MIREGETFLDGSLTTKYVPSGAAFNASPRMMSSNQPTGERYRWVSDGDSVRTRSAEGYTVESGRYRGRGVTLYGNGEAVAVSYSSSTSSRAMYLGKDIMGSVRSVTVDTGTLEERYEYDAFGTPYKGDLSGGMNLGYTGKPYDSATGLYNYGYRDYKPEAARFTTVDPIRDGNNWFAYVNNDPVNYFDPWGLFIINNKNGPSADEYQENHPNHRPGQALGVSGAPHTVQDNGHIGFSTSREDVELPNNLNNALSTSYRYQTDNNPNTKATITASAKELPSGNYEISISVTNTTINPNTGKAIPVNRSGIIAYAGPGEVGIGPSKNLEPAAVNGIVNEAISYVNNTGEHDYKVKCSD